MNDAIPAGEQFALAACHFHPDLAAQQIGPNGEPLCSKCAYWLANNIVRAAKVKKRKSRKLATSIKSRNAR